MKIIIEKLKRNTKKGQSLVEYGLILALVAVISVSALQILGSKINSSAIKAGDTVQSASESAGKAYCDSIGGAWADDTCTPPGMGTSTGTGTGSSSGGSTGSSSGGYSGSSSGGWGPY